MGYIGSIAIPHDAMPDIAMLIIEALQDTRDDDDM